MDALSDPTQIETQLRAQGRPAQVDCLDQLDRLIRRGALSSDARRYLLLEYLVSHYLETGPDAPIKAYSIAVDVMGRGPDFDPAQDSIVRVEIGRLRNLLEMYYLGPGRDDPVRFELPKGRTRLNVSFRRTKSEASSVPDQTAKGSAAPLAGRRRVLWLLAAIAAIAANIANCCLLMD